MGKRGAHYASLDAVKEALGEKAYESAKVQVEAGPPAASVQGQGGILARAALRDGVVEHDPIDSSALADALKEANKAHGLLGPLTLWVCVESHRERDVDGVSVKAFVDALITAGVLKGDTCKTIVREVKEVVLIPNDQPERTILKLFQETYDAADNV